MKFFSFFILSVILTGCLSQKNIIGAYSLKDIPKTQLTINKDSTFKFVRINPNPYLIVEYRHDDHFFITQGKWELSKKKELVLTSGSDSLIYPLVKVDFDTSKKLEYSSIKFLDIYNDSVGFGSIIYPDSEISSNTDAHELLYSWEIDFRKIDSAEFVFYGYKHWRIVSKNGRNENITVHLTPEYRPAYFQDAKFKIKHNRIIQKTNNEKYIFKKINNN